MRLTLTSLRRRIGRQRLPCVRSAAAMLAVVLCAAGVETAGAAIPGPDRIDLRLDFETGDTSQFSSLECPNPGLQLEVYDASSAAGPAPRQGRYAARFSETAHDVWAGNGIVRCLAARYDSGESDGKDFYYAFSLYVPETGISDNLLWELHHPYSLYSLPGCAVAPLALHTRNGGLMFRIATGDCTPGTGWAYWQPNIPLPGLERMPLATWLDIVLHISFSESNGTVELWYRSGSDALPATPQLARYGIPTLPYADSTGVHDVTLYTAMGLYAGRSGYSSSDTVYLDGYRRGTSKAAVEAELSAPVATVVPPTRNERPTSPTEPPLGAAPPTEVAAADAPANSVPPVISGTPRQDEVLSASAGTWSNEPSDYAFQWQWSRDAGVTWMDVRGASGSTFDVAGTFVDAKVRVVVTAANAAGSASTASLAVAPVAAADTTVAAVAPAAPAPRPTSMMLPAITGSPNVGGVLTTSTGSWSNEPANFTYQWQWSRDNGATWLDVRYATGPRFDVSSTFVCAKVRVLVTATNDAGSTTAASDPVSPGS